MVFGPWDAPTYSATTPKAFPSLPKAKYVIQPRIGETVAIDSACFPISDLKTFDFAAF